MEVTQTLFQEQLIFTDKIMHKDTIKRIAEAKETIDKRPELASKLPKKDYENFKNGVNRLCEDILKENITSEQKQKVAWIKSRIEIEL